MRPGGRWSSLPSHMDVCEVIENPNVVLDRVVDFYVLWDLSLVFEADFELYALSQSFTNVLHNAIFQSSHSSLSSTLSTSWQVPATPCLYCTSVIYASYFVSTTFPIAPIQELLPAVVLVQYCCKNFSCYNIVGVVVPISGNTFFCIAYY